MQKDRIAIMRDSKGRFIKGFGGTKVNKGKGLFQKGHKGLLNHANSTSFKKGQIPWNKGKPHPQASRRGSDNPNWRGGKTTTVDGYVKLYHPDHPHADSYGYVYESRLVMEKKLGRYLKPFEVVHHRNEIRNDNRSENLKVMSKSEHTHLHNAKR